MLLILVLQTIVTNLFQRNNSGNDSHDSLSDLRRIAKTAVLLLAAGAASFLLDWLQAPLGWLLGPLVVGIVYAISQESPQPISPAFSIIGQAIHFGGDTGVVVSMHMTRMFIILGLRSVLVAPMVRDGLIMGGGD